MGPTREDVVVVTKTFLSDPSHKGLPSALRDFKLNGALGLLLHYNSAAQYAATVADIPDPQ
jgi:hypothetical protein